MKWDDDEFDLELRAITRGQQGPGHVAEHNTMDRALRDTRRELHGLRGAVVVLLVWIIVLTMLLFMVR